MFASGLTQRMPVVKILWLLQRHTWTLPRDIPEHGWSPQVFSELKEADSLYDHSPGRYLMSSLNILWKWSIHTWCSANPTISPQQLDPLNNPEMAEPKNSRGITPRQKMVSLWSKTRCWIWSWLAQDRKDWTFRTSGTSSIPAASSKQAVDFLGKEEHV